MRTLCLLLAGVLVGWAASGVDWTRDAVGQDAPAYQTADGALTFDSPKPASVAPQPTDSEPTLTPPRGGRVQEGVRRVYETRMTVDAHGARHTEVTSRLVNPDGTIVPETPTQGLVGRYQVSAYGWPGGHGCYVVDTMTGKTWHNALGQETSVAVEALGSQPTQNLAPAWPAPRPPTPTIQTTPSVVPTPGHAEPAPMPQATPPAYSEPKVVESEAPAAN